jgi:hypothetical protein
MQLNLNNSDQSSFSNGPSPWFKVFLGFIQTFALHCLQVIPFLLALSVGDRALDRTFYQVLGLSGVTQLFYMIPAIVYYQHRDESERRTGLIICTLLTLLLGFPFFLMTLAFGFESQDGSPN